MKKTIFIILRMELNITCYGVNMKDFKVGQLVHYMNRDNRIMRGKVEGKVNNRFYKITNCNYLVSEERVFQNDQQVTKFFNQTKGWTKPEK